MEQVRTMMMAMLPGMGGATGASHWAAQDIVVDGRDQSDIVLRLQPGMTMTGKIAFDATSLTPPGDLSAVRLTMGDDRGRRVGDRHGAVVHNVYGDSYDGRGARSRRRGSRRASID
jgi:hypothetical protein